MTRCDPCFESVVGQFTDGDSEMSESGVRNGASGMVATVANEQAAEVNLNRLPGLSMQDVPRQSLCDAPSGTRAHALVGRDCASTGAEQSVEQAHSRQALVCTCGRPLPLSGDDLAGMLLTSAGCLHRTGADSGHAFADHQRCLTVN